MQIPGKEKGNMADLPIVTLTGAAAALGEAVVERFGSRLRGKLLRPGDAGYEEARLLWNGLIDKRPALIARCAGVADVIDSVNFARENDSLVAVRGGGHNVAGNAVCDGGLVIDLSPMKGIRVDPERSPVRAESGATLGDLDRETQIFGLATPMGVVSETGIAGLTLGGIGGAIADLSARMPYTVAQSGFDEDYPDGWRYYWKSQNIRGLNDEVIERLLIHAEAAPSDHSTVDVWYQGGAMNRIEASKSAFGDRSAPIWIGVEANWEDAQDDEANIAWVRECVADMRRFSGGGAYLNFAGFFEEGDRLIQEAFGENHKRLVDLKNKYDPTNLFRLNQNIKPTASEVH